ncbi:extracellular solute-binding protein [Streptomyces sp. NPDC059008]|uniref:extracellular solute-binding protein n=1 Tax=Streptomyces sp. NPDC059008 TaxID=3346693 RepID=UPI0036C7C40A
MKRRTVTAGAAGALGAAVLAAAGCTPPGDRSGGQVMLTMLTHYTGEPVKSALQASVDAWNATHRRVQVRTAAVPFAYLLTTFMVRQAAGQLADIIHPYGLWTGQLVRAGVLRPAPREAARLIRRDFSPAAVAAASADGTVYGYPTEVQTYALYYNRRLLREAGIDQPPRTWRELEDAAYRTARQDRYGNPLVQGLGLSWGSQLAAADQALALLAARGGAFLSPDGRRSAIGSVAGRDVLGLQRRLIVRGAATASTSLTRAFPAGQVAMVIYAGWWRARLKDEMGADYRDVGVAPIPGRVRDDRGTLLNGFLLGVNARSRHPREAWEFLRWLNAEPVLTAGARGGAERRVAVSRMSALQMEAGSMTSRAADVRALLGREGLSADPNLLPFLDALRYAVPESNGPHAQRAKTMLRKAIEDVWTGRASVDAALSTLTTRLDHELARQ